MTEREAAVRRCNDALKKRFGEVVRARGPYLYTKKGVRITDLYLDEGRAVLGRGCSGSHAFRVLKNTLERGETGSFPSAYETRFQKAVLSLIPGYDYAARFSGEDSLLRAAAFYQSGCMDVPVAVSRANSALRVKLWRPWQTETADAEMLENGTAAVGTTPGSIAEGVLAFYPPLALQEAGLIAVFKAGNKPFPPSDPCSGALLNALTRSIYDLQREIPKRGEKDWGRFDTVLSPYFERRGAYLIPVIKAEQYEAFVLHCLDCRLLIPPFPAPALVPVGVNEGDFSRLKQTPFQ
ncbi:hypothetical protein V1L52_02880 [Treponema sp. HNW]|uniref:hypothetical protein n=1 Tax=Treponema sp. HNW TaxID=3116654 RepID=UPI003D0A10BF